MSSLPSIYSAKLTHSTKWESNQDSTKMLNETPSKNYTNYNNSQFSLKLSSPILQLNLIKSRSTTRNRIKQCYPPPLDKFQESLSYKPSYIKMRTEGQNVNTNSEFEQAREKILLNKLQCETEDPYFDEIQREIVGLSAPGSYFDAYKHLDCTRQQNKFAHIQDTMQTMMLNQSESLNLLPCKLGIIKLKGNPKQLNINRHCYGNKYGDMLSEGLRNHLVITDFNLGFNRLESAGASNILQQVAKQARTLELASNKVGRQGCETIAKQIMSRDCRIEILNLEDNRLGDMAVQILCNALSSDSKLKVLNISKNSLTNLIVESLCRSLSACNSLEELYLHWNRIKGNAGSKIFETLDKECDNLRVLDFSYNSLGQVGGTLLMSTLNDFLKNNKYLLHLDLSANCFSMQDSKFIAQSLNQNNTIQGFHFTGNFGYVDSKGFLIVESNVKDYPDFKRINSTNPLKKCSSSMERTDKLKDVCWVCDGWHQTTIKWEPGLSGDLDADPIYWHADFEGYEPIYMKDNSKGYYELQRMVPPGEMTYFFTANDVQVANQMSKIRVCMDRFKKRVIVDNRIVRYQLDEVNQMEFHGTNQVIENYEPLISILPRTPDDVYMLAQRIKQKVIWTYPQSIWAKKFKLDTPEHIKKCFERDWACSKITKFIKLPEEQKAIMELLWNAYQMIRETYKHYASYNPNGDVYSISLNPVSELVNQCQLIDGKQLKLADVDLKFIATCSASAQEWKGNYRNPERAIVRYQMMEFMVRVAEDKYVRGQAGVSMTSAVTSIIEQCRPHMSNFDSHKWRLERYFCEQCDVLIKKYKWLIDYIYERNSSKKVKPGKPAFMCLDELRDICNRVSLSEENFLDRDVNLAFNLSMMTQIDELESDRIFQMSWIEFAEALARISEKLSLIPLGKQSSQEWTHEMKNGSQLYYKFEAFLVMLIRRMVDEDTKKNYQIPITSMFEE